MTHKPMVFAAVRMPREDREHWYVAAKLEGVSQSAFLRDALRAHVKRALVEVTTRTAER